MKLESIVPSNKLITEGQILYDSTYKRYLEQSNSQAQKVEQRLLEPEEGGNEGLLLMHREFQFCKIKKFSRWLGVIVVQQCDCMHYLMLLSYHLKMVSMVNFIYILPQTNQPISLFRKFRKPQRLFFFFPKDLTHTNSSNFLTRVLEINNSAYYFSSVSCFIPFIIGVAQPVNYIFISYSQINRNSKQISRIWASSESIIVVT